ncbi:CAP-associated domain-containing protein [Fusibacter bizertensis]
MLRTKNKVLIIALIICLIMTTFAMPVNSFAATFSDVNGHWAQTYIDTIQPLGVIAGYPNGTFKPNNDITRIEFIAIIVNALNLDVRATNTNEYWGAPFAEVALATSLITDDEYGGINENNLNKNISREEMASIVVNAFYSRGKTVTEDQKEAAILSLSDFDTVSPQYYDHSVASVALGIIGGFPNATFGPKERASRAQAAVVSYKLLVELGVISASSNDPSLTQTTAFSVNGIEIGDAYDWVIQKYGQPLRQDVSEYGFKWLVYHSDYKNYYQIGILNNKVVALYTSSNLLKSKIGLSMNLTKAETTKILGTPLGYIQKGNIQYLQYDSNETATYLSNNAYVTAYFDALDSGKLFSIKIIDYKVEQSFKSQYGTASDALRISYEKTVFDLTNVFRVAHNKPLLKWHEALSNVARKHSKDMSDRNFFSHENPSGYSPFDRILADGIDYQIAAENIAAGYTNAFSAHSGWVNSPGHRDNLLRDIAYIGVGIYIGGEYVNYFTQDFITP